jgi:L-lactate dehydrogenase complex protein LldG
MTPDPREAILGRVRQALARPSAEPHWLHEPVGHGPHFPLPPEEVPALRKRFCAEFADLLGEFHTSGDVAAAREWIAEWVTREGFRPILAPQSPRLAPLLDGLAGVAWIPSDHPDIAGWGEAGLAITPCLGLIAESATIAVAADVSGRCLTVLPPVHLVVATEDQLVPSLEKMFERIRVRYSGGLPSSLSWISGPSRTADIEKILVLGAHGPKRLALLLLPPESLPPI